ncbi:putative protein phosphatase 2C BIPP2C1 [Hibiscus syriacus]|uniref:Protein phosphatase n=1 Tax=Hibiscus syriacus TaxID=106335 RepID=A0A6A3BYM1_HIBSY|nr:putative protein phosphatase 2C BIPP2C1 [Hibiscus syriacus]
MWQRLGLIYYRESYWTSSPEACHEASNTSPWSGRAFCNDHTKVYPVWKWEMMMDEESLSNGGKRRNRQRPAANLIQHLLDLPNHVVHTNLISTKGHARVGFADCTPDFNCCGVQKKVSAYTRGHGIKEPSHNLTIVTHSLSKNSVSRSRLLGFTSNVAQSFFAQEKILIDLDHSRKLLLFNQWQSVEAVHFSFLKEEITEVEAQSDNKFSVKMLKGVELQSGGTTLEREEIPTAGFFLYSGAALLPNPTKTFAGGEDAYFIASQNWLGVADGVSQWSLEGISVGVYAKELTENCERIVCDRNGVPNPITDPVEVLNRAAANTQTCGLSTVLVAYFDDRALHVANIGESGFMIVRNGAVFKRSSPMLCELNCPVQIERGDYPSDFVEVYRIDLDENDVIITATDGLFDNLYGKDIASIVFRSLQENLRPQEIAELLATRSQEVGQLSLVRSPLSDEVQAAGYVGYRGGKLDDVIVIVSVVKRRFSNHVHFTYHIWLWKAIENPIAQIRPTARELSR